MPTWNKIYKDIFKNSKWMLKQKKRLSNKYDIQNSQRYFEKMLLNLWRCESKESKRYFI